MHAPATKQSPPNSPPKACLSQPLTLHQISEHSVISTSAMQYHSRPELHFAPVQLQPKLTVNRPGDEYEREADLVASAVMRMPDPVPESSGMTSDSRVSSGKESGDKLTILSGHAVLQRLSTPRDSVAGAAAPSSVGRVLDTPGQQLPDQTRTFMESRFGHDFSKVRVHTDPLAERSAREVSARAYTVGEHIAFGRGEFRPDSISGRELLAHELAHTIQQGGSVCRKADQSGENLDEQLVAGISFVARPEGTELFEMPDASSKILAKLPDCQRVRRMTNEKLGGHWSKVIVEGFLSNGKVGYVHDEVLKTPPDAELVNDPGLKLHRVTGGETFWDLVRREYGIRGDEGTADLNINHFINAIRAKNKPEAFAVKAGRLDRLSNWLISGRDASDTELKRNYLLWIPSYSAAVKMDVASGTVTGEVARVRKKIEQKLRDFREALSLSGPLFLDAIGELAKDFGPQLIQGLITFAKEAAVILGASTAVGALIGAVFGGVGAVPGATIGFEIGLMILQIYGLYEAVAGVLNTFGTFFMTLGSAISLTWQANGDPRALQQAAMEFAKAFALLSSVLLAALFAYLTKKGFNAIKGTRFAKTVGESELAEWFKARQSGTSARRAANDRLENSSRSSRTGRENGGESTNRGTADPTPNSTAQNDNPPKVAGGTTDDLGTGPNSTKQVGTPDSQVGPNPDSVQTPSSDQSVKSGNGQQESSTLQTTNKRLSEKRETVDEFLARGGKIQMIPAQPPPKGGTTARPTRERKKGTYRGRGSDQMKKDYAHDLGAHMGHEKAVEQKLSKYFDNPRGSEKTSRGFDSVYKTESGDLVVVEFKGGTSKLGKSQMSKSWVSREIEVLDKIYPNHPVVQELKAALKDGRLSGRTYTTQIDHVGNPLPTRVKVHQY